MFRQFLQQILPTRKTVSGHWLIRRLGFNLNIPCLFALNKRTIPMAAGVGIFIAFLPIPFQMALVTLLAILMHINLPLALMMVMITNPFTMGPIYYLCYQIGAWVIQPPLLTSQNSTLNYLLQIGFPLWTGCLLVGSIAAILAYLVSRLLWTNALLERRGKLAQRLTMLHKKHRLARQQLPG
ncbi:MAG: DUF2062 domain-containing protein [Gammaproteobacteria bacterium]